MEPGDDAFRKIKPAVKKRDRDTCRFCSAASAQNEVHHADDDHENNSGQNLIVACQLCHACHHIGFLGDAATLAYLPASTLSQEDLSHFFRAIGVALLAGGEWTERAKAILEDMKLNEELFKRRWTTSNPREVGEALLSLDNANYNQRATVLTDVRVVFKANACIAAANKFKAAFSQMPVNLWERIANDSLLERDVKIDGAFPSFQPED